MSHIDNKLLFSDAQAVTSTAISTNVVALEGTGLSPNATQNLGDPAKAYLVVETAVACTDSGSDATLTVTLESATDAGLTTGAVVHAATAALAFAAFSAKGTVVMCIPLPFGAYKDYIGVRYTVASGPLTAGAFNAYITLDPRQYVAFKNDKPEHA